MYHLPTSLLVLIFVLFFNRNTHPDTCEVNINGLLIWIGCFYRHNIEQRRETPHATPIDYVSIPELGTTLIYVEPKEETIAV